MYSESDQTAILEQMKPETYATFCCPGCDFEVRPMADKRPRIVESKGRKTTVTRCVYCEGNKAPKPD